MKFSIFPPLYIYDNYSYFVLFFAVLTPLDSSKYWGKKGKKIGLKYRTSTKTACSQSSMQTSTRALPGIPLIQGPETHSKWVHRR